MEKTEDEERETEDLVAKKMATFLVELLRSETKSWIDGASCREKNVQKTSYFFFTELSLCPDEENCDYKSDEEGALIMIRGVGSFLLDECLYIR